MSTLRFSVVINNYNYARFLHTAIESALSQDYPNLEVVVVDDGSTDDSRAVIASFGDNVRPVLKENGGQGSAFNAGFAASSGDIVLFLDSDDTLHSDAARRLIECFDDPTTVKVQSRMRLIDKDGASLGAEEPPGKLLGGEWRDEALRLGPSAYPSTPTSAGAWRRSFLTQVLPMPEEGYRVAADGYLKNIAPLFGRIASVQEPLVDYRLHGSNTSHWGWHDDPRGRFARDTAHYELACEQLARWANSRGHACKAEDWTHHRWQHLARKHVLHRLGGGIEHRVPALRCARAAMEGSIVKRPLVMLIVAAIYLAPKRVATSLVLRLFRKKKIGEGLLSMASTTSTVAEESPLRVTAP